MEALNGSLFLCAAVPLALSLLLLERRARRTAAALLAGMFLCLLAGEINTLLLVLLRRDLFYMTTCVTPVVEEGAKAAAVLSFAFLVSGDRGELLSLSAAAGLGFALMENICVAVSAGEISPLWALLRGLGAGLMHSVCACAVGYGASFVRKRRKLFYTGTFALFSAAVTYHAIYNCLVQSEWPALGVCLSIGAYLSLVWAARRKSEEAERRDSKWKI